MAMRSSETDYLVVGAGAMGMAFTDALIDHADVHVTLVDRRHAAGGHWQDAYPFVQLHQASLFYGVASTVLGQRRGAAARPGGGAPGTGPSVGDPGLLRRRPASPLRRLGPRHLPRRERVPHGRLLPSRDLPGVGRDRARSTCARRVVDATYLSPTIPATTPPPFGVADDVRVVADQRARPVGRGAEQLRDRRFRQDRHRRDRVVVGERRARRTASSGSARVTRGCSTAPSSSPIRRWRSGWLPTPWRRPPTPSRSTISSCASKRPA